MFICGETNIRKYTFLFVYYDSLFEFWKIMQSHNLEIKKREIFSNTKSA